MAIIVSQNGRDAKKVEASHFRDEAHLQEYIHTNPGSLPLHEIDEDIRLLILAREFPTQSGPIDALGVDGEGNIYVIETKLYKNPDKRTVVAQVMDYGAALWRGYVSFSDFLDVLNDLSLRQCAKDAVDRFKEFYGVSDDAAGVFKDNLRKNLSTGQFRFVVLMDKLTDRLKDLIVFINQNSQFDIYGVELEYYRHDTWEILIPRLFGAKVQKTDPDAGGKRRKWDEKSFFEAAAKALDASQLAAVRVLFEHTSKKFDISWGTGNIHGSFNARSQGIPGGLYTVNTAGVLAVVVNSMTPEESERFLRTSTLGVRQGLGGSWWMGFTIETWAGKVDSIIRAIEEFVASRPAPG